MSKTKYKNIKLEVKDEPSANVDYGEYITDLYGEVTNDFIGCGEDYIEESKIQALTNCAKREIKQEEIKFLIDLAKFCFLCNDYKKKKYVLFEKIGFNIINSANAIKKANNEKYVFFSYMTINKQVIFPFNYEIYVSTKDASIKRISYFCTRDQAEVLYPLNLVSLFDILLSIYIDINNLSIEKQERFIEPLMIDMFPKQTNKITQSSVGYSNFPNFEERNKIIEMYAEYEDADWKQNDIFADLARNFIKALKGE